MAVALDEFQTVKGLLNCSKNADSGIDEYYGVTRKQKKLKYSFGYFQSKNIITGRNLVLLAFEKVSFYQVRLFNNDHIFIS